MTRRPLIIIALCLGIALLLPMAPSPVNAAQEVQGYVDAGTQLTKSMYITSATWQGNHNADASPGSFCAAGYHLCDPMEIFGRRLEDSGTGRYTAPGWATGWFDIKAGYSSQDCTDWTSTSSTGSTLAVATSGTDDETQRALNACSNSYGIWCCQD